MTGHISKCVKCERVGIVDHESKGFFHLTEGDQVQVIPVLVLSKLVKFVALELVRLQRQTRPGLLNRSVLAMIVLTVLPLL